MGIKLPPLWIAFLIALITKLAFLPTPAAKLATFTPCIVIAFYRCPKITCLWIAFGLGFSLDLLATTTRFGLYATSATLTALILHRAKTQFFEDSVSTLPILTGLFSATQTLLLLALNSTLSAPVPTSLLMLFTDVIAMPALDALFAYVAFTLPSSLKLFHPKKRQTRILKRFEGRKRPQ